LPVHLSLYICVYCQIGRLNEGERYQSIFITGEIRAWKVFLVVTKVMDCDDLLYDDGEPKQQAE